MFTNDDRGRLHQFHHFGFSPVRVAEFDERSEDVRHKYSLGVVRLQVQHVAPVLPERPLVLRILEVVSKPGRMVNPGACITSM